MMQKSVVLITMSVPSIGFTVLLDLSNRAHKPLPAVCNIKNMKTQMDAGLRILLKWPLSISLISRVIPQLGQVIPS